MLSVYYVFCLSPSCRGQQTPLAPSVSQTFEENDEDIYDVTPEPGKLSFYELDDLSNIIKVVKQSIIL